MSDSAQSLDSGAGTGRTPDRVGSCDRTGRQNLPETTRVSDALIGYARVSTQDQSLDRQLTELTTVGCSRVFTDHGVSGSKMHRPGLDDALDYLRSGDTLVVVELSRLGRDALGVVALARELEDREVGLRILGLGLDTTTASGRLVLTILAAVAEMEKELLRERVQSGLAEARRQGRTGGRPPALTEEQKALAARLVGEGQRPSQVAQLLNVSTRTVQRYTTSTTDEGTPT
mgnify:CR=1 FL=1